MNAACCTDSSNCATGFPRACDAGCAAVRHRCLLALTSAHPCLALSHLRSAQVWLPFAAPCTDFIAAQFPNLVSLTRRCTTAQGDQPVPPPPPAAAGSGGSVFYASGQVALSNANVGSSSKAQHKFVQNLRGDVAEALDVNQASILISDASSSSVTLDLFSDSQAHAQALVAALQSQLADPASILMQGTSSSSITPGQQLRFTVLAVGAADASGGGNFASGSSQLGTLNVRVDDQSTYYFNGVELGSTVVSQWTDVVTSTFMAPCGDANAQPVRKLSPRSALPHLRFRADRS